MPAALLLLVSFLLSLLSPHLASAATLAETRGIGARAIAMGGAFTAVADDASALYYNPAGLAQLHGHHIHLEYVFVLPRLYLQRGSASKELFVDKETKAPMLAFVMDLSKTFKLPRQLIVGWNAYFPDNFKSLWKVRYGSLRHDPYSPVYGDGHVDHGFGLWAGAAVEVLPWLLVGGGVSFLLHAKHFAIDIAFDENLNIIEEQNKTTIDATTEVFPLAGILLKPIPGLRLGFAWRAEAQVLFGGGGGIELLAKFVSQEQTILIPIPLKLPIHMHYRPAQYAVGASYQLLEDLLLAIDLTYYDWSRFKDEAERDLDPPMKGIFVPRFGMEYYLLEKLALRAGYSFQESPLRQQNIGYHTNAVDNDVHTVSVGLGYFWQIWGFPRNPAQFSIFYQLQILPPRTFQNVHLGEPELTSSGVFHSFGFGIHLTL